MPWSIAFCLGHSALGILHVLAILLAFGASHVCLWHGMTGFHHACARPCAFGTCLVAPRAPPL